MRRWILADEQTENYDACDYTNRVSKIDISQISPLKVGTSQIGIGQFSSLAKTEEGIQY